MASLPTADEMRSAYPALAHYETDDEKAEIAAMILDARNRICVVLRQRYKVSLWPDASYPPAVSSWVKEGAFALMITSPKVEGAGEEGDNTGAALWKRIMDEVREVAKKGGLLDDDLEEVEEELPSKPPGASQATVRLRTLEPMNTLDDPARSRITLPQRTISTRRGEWV